MSASFDSLKEAVNEAVVKLTAPPPAPVEVGTSDADLDVVTAQLRAALAPPVVAPV